jgi:GDPmannose 4,6-dehydratase
LSKSALIIGITGQDGSYLSEFLLAKGYTVHGVVRRSSSFNTARINHIYEDPHEAGRRLLLHYGDLTDSTGLRRVLEVALPDEIYNLGAQSHVKVSFENPEYTADAVALGTLRVLDCMRDHIEHTGRQVRFYQAGSSEMFGAARPPQDEHTPFYPRSPYAVSKVAAHWYAVNYREAYNLFISNGILFNHESPRRGETFVTRKITRAVGRIKMGLQEKLFLGNLEARRDWGFAGDYVEAMWAMLQHAEPGDFVVASGEAHSVRQFLDEAFSHAGLDWQRYVQIDPLYFRPTEVDHLQGDSAKARSAFGWRPKTGFQQLVRMMVDADLRLAEQERLVQGRKLTAAL